MTVRLNLDLNLSISSTSADEKDLGNLRSVLYTLSTGEGGTRKVVVAGGLTDYEVGLCNITTARFLFIKLKPVDDNDPAQAVTIKLNSALATPTTIKPFADGKIGYYLVTTDGLTALYVTNAGTVAVELTLAVAGD